MIYSGLYWRFGFQTGLYDVLMPEAYLESIRRLIKWIPAYKNPICIDIGCGSGTIVKYLKPIIKEGTYIGLDALLTGLVSARIKAEIENISNKVHLVQSDLTPFIPIKNNSVDIIVAHFFLYTLDSQTRGTIFREFRSLLRKGGVLALVEPSPKYSARRIIEQSISMELANGKIATAWMKKWIVYPLTYQFGLKFIERQLKKGVWSASKSEELRGEIRLNGFEVNHIETVYADSATLLISS